jgi:hypothetical protein
MAPHGASRTRQESSECCEAEQADLARLVGVSRARVTQVMSLLWLAPDIQEAVLDALPGVPGSERALRGVASHMLWAVQREILALADSASGSVITVVTDESTPPHLTGHMPQRGP